ncbi:isochorismatase family protein [Ktedonosporobacter rubrisoli]|uniref:Isochorismatase family protein n=1 Tax=Ktedonosporobacter rubrisoli TaxID=2509675 RepID=A0A4P6JNE8_KTERU|nr:isochorismatase family protein [Ktedonosporobacter rubrisoli]QBD76592.1 isochorismatase family protein [Ktedonosporobacter rubrisoli]
MTNLEPVTPENSSIILIDYSVGFANLIGSTTVEHNVNSVTALAKVALTFNVPLIVTNGQDTDTPGPIYPALHHLIADHPVVRRGGNFNAFETPEFAAAVEATGRKKLIMAGLMTEGCLLLTALEGLRRGFDVYVVIDACGGETVETHQIAVSRLVQAGAIPVSWFSLAAEYQRSWARQETVEDFLHVVLEHSPAFALNLAHHTAAQQSGHRVQA